MSTTEVTNAMYEAFDPQHSTYRGRLNFSSGDNEAAVWVSWYNATAYAAWLRAQTGIAWRLPTEAEWEFAARGNDSSTRYSYFWTGDTVPNEMQKNQKDAGLPPVHHDAIDLTVGKTAANGFGLHDTIGNVEEWVHDWWDWYDGPPPSTTGPKSSTAADPTGPVNGTFRVTRGGSHSTLLYYLRTANRAAALPDERSWYIGIRLAADTDPETGEAALVDRGADQLHADSNSRELPPTAPHGIKDIRRAELSPGASSMAPIVTKYVNIGGDGVTYLPFAYHNHDPTLVVCPDNSVLTAWFSGDGEIGREVGLATARMPAGGSKFPNASVFLDAPDRCQCCPSFFLDPDSKVLYSFSSMSAAGDYSDIVGVLRWSTDCGLTWNEAPDIIWPDHGIAHQIVVTTIKNSHGEVLVPADHWGELPYVKKGDQSVIQHAPAGKLADRSAWTVNSTGQTGSHHSSIVELRNGSYVAVGRGHPINGTMAFSYSVNDAFSWIAHESSFPMIHGGQREVMIRLGAIDQPIMCCSFANDPMPVPSSDGGTFEATGLYCALSFDEGETFAQRRVMTDDETVEGHMQEGFDGRMFRMSYNSSEPDGYMDADVGPDGTIHLITSRNHYKFNLPWLSTPATPPAATGS